MPAKTAPAQRSPRDSSPDPSTSLPCPDEDSLLRFADGDGDAATAAHVRSCSRCQRALELCLRSASREGSDELGDDALIQWVEEQQARRAAALAVGARLERYEIVRRLGEGGMGVVYEAHDPDLDRPVAIKLMHPQKPAGGDENRRLLREARALARVSHPHVVAVHDVGTVDDRVFLVMELVRGATLREWLLEPRARTAVLDAFIQAGRGLAAAHAAGLIHRDFKPDNVLLGDDGRVRVTDFGLARAARRAPEDSRITGSAAVVGTPSFMAPEVQRGDHADARSDQFSFAVALHRALAGHSPRPDLPLADDGGAALPRRLRKALRRALALDPAARFPSMEALVAELEGARRDRLGRQVGAAGAALALVAALAYAATRGPSGAGSEGADARPTDAASPAIDATPDEVPVVERPPVTEPTSTPTHTTTTAVGVVAGVSAPMAPASARADAPPASPAPPKTPPLSSPPAAPSPPPPAPLKDPLSEF